MATETGLAKLTLLYTAGNLASKVITFGLFFLYTFFLTKEDLGSFDLIVSTMSLLTPILSLQIYDALLRWLLSRNEKTEPSIISNSIYLLLVSMGVILIVGIFVPLFITINHWTLICVLTILNTSYPVFQYIARGTGHNKEYVISGVLFSIIFTAMAVLTLYVFNLAIEGLLLSNVIAVGASILYLIAKINIIQYLKPSHLDMKLLREMIRFSIPLIPNTLGWWAISMANRYIIVLFLGVALNGVFAVAMKFPSILFMLTNIFYMAWQEKAIRSYHLPNRDAYYTSIFSKYLSLLFGALAILIAITKPLLKFLVAPAYQESWKFLPILYLAIGYQALSSFYGTGYLSSKDTSGAFLTTLCGAIATISMSFLLIPRFGLIGASIAILSGYIVLFITRVYQTKRYFKITIQLRLFIFFNFIIVVVSAATISENITIQILNICLACVVTLFANKDTIRTYSQKITFSKILS
jgi:O-antigen/teichoic acid export membrane protein